MGVRVDGIKKLIAPFLFEKNGKVYLRKESIDEVNDVIMNRYTDVYTWIENNEFNREIFMVGNLTKRLKKPVFKVLIEDEDLDNDIR